MSNEHFYKHPALPFAECRYSSDSNRHYKPHMHKTFSIGAIDKGAVGYRIGGQTVRLHPGSLALINPEVLHSCNPDESGRRSYYMLYLDVDWCLQVQQSLWQIDTFSPVTIRLLDNNSVYQQFITVMDVFMNEGELMEKEQLLAELVEVVFSEACEPAAVTNVPSLQTEQLKLLLSRNLDTDTSLKQLAIDLQANPYTLLRNFKSSTGITPHAYRLNCRIDLARTLLQEGADVAQVALECGFYDQSHFHRYFKAVTTVTPKEYQVNFLQ